MNVPPSYETYIRNFTPLLLESLEEVFKEKIFGSFLIHFHQMLNDAHSNNHSILNAICPNKDLTTILSEIYEQETRSIHQAFEYRKYQHLNELESIKNSTADLGNKKTIQSSQDLHKEPIKLEKLLMASHTENASKGKIVISGDNKNSQISLADSSIQGGNSSNCVQPQVKSSKFPNNPKITPDLDQQEKELYIWYMSNSFFSTKPKKAAKLEQKIQATEQQEDGTQLYGSYNRDCQKIIGAVYQESDPVLKNLSMILDPDSTIKSSGEESSCLAIHSTQP